MTFCNEGITTIFRYKKITEEQRDFTKRWRCRDTILYNIQPHACGTGNL